MVFYLYDFQLNRILSNYACRELSFYNDFCDESSLIRKLPQRVSEKFLRFETKTFLFLLILQLLMSTGIESSKFNSSCVICFMISTHVLCQ